MNVKRIISFTAVSSGATRAIAIASSLITFPLIMESLGKSNYGIWVLIGQCLGMIGLSDLGVSASLGRVVAKLRGKKNHVLLDRLFGTGLLTLFGSSLFIVLLGTLSIPFIIRGFKIEEASIQIANATFFVSLLALSIQLPLRTFGGFLSGYHAHHYVNVSRAGSYLFYMMGVIILAKEGALTLLTLAIAQGTSLILGEASNAIFLKRLQSIPKMSEWRWRKSLFRILISIGSASLIVTVSSLLGTSAISIAIGTFLPTEKIAIFGTALLLMTHASFLLTRTLIRPLTPIVSELHGRGETEKLKQTTINIMRWLSIFSASSLVFILFGLRNLVEVLLKYSDWLEADYFVLNQCLWIMGLCLAISAPMFVLRTALLGLGQHWYVAKGFLIGSIIAFGCGILFAWQFGVVGAAIGWGLLYLLPSGFFSFSKIRLELNVSWKEALKAYLPGYQSAVAMILLWVFIARPLLNEYSIITQVFSVGFLSLLSFCLGFLLVKKPLF